MQFGDFAAQGHRTVARAEVLKLGKQFGHAVGALVQHDGARRREQRRQPLLAAFLVGQEPFEQEPVARQARGHQSRHKGGGPGKALDVDAGLHAGANEQKSWIGNAGVPASGAAPGSRRLPIVGPRPSRHGARCVGERPEAGCRRHSAAGVFPWFGCLPRGRRDLLQHLQRTGRHVAQIAHRSGHHDEFASAHDTKVRTMRLANAS